MLFSAFSEYLRVNNIKNFVFAKTSDLVSFKIGGNAKCVIYPKTENEFITILKLLRREKFIVLGKGTNCYFTDEEYDGTVIVTTELNQISIRHTALVCQCGCSINYACKVACDNSLSGLEFAYGIPGSVGGGVYMNASAFNSCFSDIVLETVAYDLQTEKIVVLNNEQHQFGVKDSVFKNKDLIILKTVLNLKNGKKTSIKNSMQVNIKRRKETQPLNLPSAGSTFVRPVDAYASQLIDLCGLKGYTIGGAQVSIKHAGFIVNIGNAKAKDVQNLVDYIKSKVKSNFGVELKEEIIFIE